VLGHWIRVDPESFLDGAAEGDGGRTRQQTCVEKYLTAANCLYISGFWGLHLHLGSAPGPRWSPRPPVPTLTSEPGYATARDHQRQEQQNWKKPRFLRHFLGF